MTRAEELEVTCSRIRCYASVHSYWHYAVCWWRSRHSITIVYIM